MKLCESHPSVSAATYIIHAGVFVCVRVCVSVEKGVDFIKFLTWVICVIILLIPWWLYFVNDETELEETAGRERSGPFDKQASRAFIHVH